jgi:chromosome segregation ATPase
MNSADVDQLRSLAALLKPLAELPAMLDRAMSADQAVREAEIRASKIAAENRDAMLVASRIRDEIAKRERHADDLLASVVLRVASIEEKAIATRDEMLDKAQDEAATTRSDADRYATSIRTEAITIDGTIKAKRAELEKIEASIKKAREQTKKLLES